MLDPIAAFFQRIFSAIGRGIGLAISWLLSPFIWLGNWYRARAWIIKGPIGIALAVLIGFYAYFIWQTQVWSGFDVDYVNSYNLGQRKQEAGAAATGASAADGDSAAATGASAAVPGDGSAG